MYGPNPNSTTPIPVAPQVVFLKNVVDHPFIEVGDFTYWDNPDGEHDFTKNVLYHFDFIGDKLIIGKYCAIANNVTFVMNGGNHAMHGPSTYPFYIFGNGWEVAAPEPGTLPYKGDTTIGHDVWIGTGVVIMPGVTIGNGAIIGSYSVVTQNVPDYAIVGGNPAAVLRHRFTADDIDTLLGIAWWNWSTEQVTKAIQVISSGDVEQLKDIAENLS